MRFRFRTVVKRESFVVVIETRYRATPFRAPTYLDERPRPRGGVKELEWHVAYLRTPAGKENNPVDMMAAEASLRLEPDFDDLVGTWCDQDFARHEDFC